MYPPFPSQPFPITHALSPYHPIPFTLAFFLITFFSLPCSFLSSPSPSPLSTLPPNLLVLYCEEVVVYLVSIFKHLLDTTSYLLLHLHIYLPHHTLHTTIKLLTSLSLSYTTPTFTHTYTVSLEPANHSINGYTHLYKAFSSQHETKYIHTKICLTPPIISFIAPPLHPKKYIFWPNLKGLSNTSI